MTETIVIIRELQAGLIDEAVLSFFSTITEKITGFWSDLWAPMFDGWPLWSSYGVFVLILLACIVVGFFLQFKWARLGLGLVVAGAGLWLFGRHTMYNDMKTKLDAERAKKKKIEREDVPPPQDNNSWGPFGKW